MEEKELKTDEQPISAGKRSALLRYIVILFAFAFILVSVSLVVQISSSNSVISDLTSSSSGAIARAEELQATNRALEDELEEQKARNTTLREAATNARQDQRRQQKAYDALLILMTTENPDGDLDYAKAIETLTELRNCLPDTAQALVGQYLDAT